MENKKLLVTAINRQNWTAVAILNRQPSWDERQELTKLVFELFCLKYGQEPDSYKYYVEA